MCEIDEFNSPYDQLSMDFNADNILADKINENIPFSISDNSTGSEDNILMNKKRINKKNHINKKSIEEQKDIKPFESQNSIELNEEEKESIKESNLGNKKTLQYTKKNNYLNKNKKNKINSICNFTTKNYSNEIGLLNLENKNILSKKSFTQKDEIHQQKILSKKSFTQKDEIHQQKRTKYSKNESFKFENENFIEENIGIISQNKEKNQPENKIISLNGETKTHTGDKSENHKKIVLNSIVVGDIKSENKSLGIKIKEEEKENSEIKYEIIVENNKEEKSEEIKKEKEENPQKENEINYFPQHTYTLQVDEDIEENYDIENIIPNQSKDLGNNDELFNISLSNVDCNKDQYKCDIINEDNFEKLTNYIII